jgi:hypothetical protein
VAHDPARRGGFGMAACGISVHAVDVASSFHPLDKAA